MDGLRQKKKIVLSAGGMGPARLGIVCACVQWVGETWAVRGETSLNANGRQLETMGSLSCQALPKMATAPQPTILNKKMKEMPTDLNFLSLTAPRGLCGRSPFGAIADRHLSGIS